ncbi:hypothetical protein [Glutamicibacter sp. TV12E]|uniref:hypothetical protein n=1 Tax=Glutamicibacter sp. TV12E TaxID=3446362 RepID=UPI0040336CB6
MTLAEKLTCAFPDTEDIQIICEIPAQFDWIAFGSMVATLVATFAALAFGVKGMHDARQAQVKEKNAQRSLRLEKSSRKILTLLDRMIEEHPEIDRSLHLQLSSTSVRLTLDARGYYVTQIAAVVHAQQQKLSESALKIRAFREADSDRKRPDDEIALDEQYVDETYLYMLNSARSDLGALLDSIDLPIDHESAKSVIRAVNSEPERITTAQEYISTVIDRMYKDGPEPSHTIKRS